jgi:hypothetical protein
MLPAVSLWLSYSIYSPWRSKEGNPGCQEQGEAKPKDFAETIVILNRLSAHQEKIVQQLILIKEAKRVLIHKVFK